MYTDPYLHLREHQRHTAQVVTDGLRRLEAASKPRPRPVRTRLVHRLAQRVRRRRLHPVAG